jgi:RNA polymerase sigma-70 factor (ECF subfamily)
VTPEQSDNDLAVRAASGDRRAFAILVRRHSTGIAKAARGFGLPETDIDDVLQEAFVATWRRLCDYDPARPFRAWLFQIAINKMRDIRRHRRVRGFLFGAATLDDGAAQGVADDAPGPEQHALASQELVHIRSVLDGLDRDLREALVLTAIVGMSQVEAAIALNTSQKGIEGRVARARRQLSASLEKM